MEVSQQSKLNTHGFMKECDTYIFDLDGTLLDSFQGLCVSCNATLRMHGIPERTIGGVWKFVDNGMKKLVERAIPNGLDNPDFEVTYADSRQHYLAHSLDSTESYPGILELLTGLHAYGKKLAAVNNEFYDATQDLCRHFLNNHVTVATSERENIRKKPAPDTVLEALRQSDDDR